jgi:glycosyltransferase involved in cell wall biosynthesis
MNFLIISHTAHIFNEGRYYAYGPYVKEMNLWLKHVDSVEIVAPREKDHPSMIMLPYKNNDIKFSEISTISLLSFIEIVKTIIKLPKIFLYLFRAMKRADHIHLRCPGNIGLLGCIVQVFFPKKKKTAKYAGNWDPKAKQPWSYRLQKWILSNTFLTRNMKVLVYGEWPEQSKNIKPFFTASYSEEKIEEILTKSYNDTLRIMFVGTLAKGKRPLYALQIVENLRNKGIDCQLDFYGEGVQREVLEEYIIEKNLGAFVKLHGNQASEVVEAAYRQSHFLILPSQSEGWPKVVAEAMFWGVVPLVTPISCVPWMLDHGNRGILLTLDVEDDTERILELLGRKEVLQQMAVQGSKWSHQYTLEVFEAELKKLI